MAIPSFKQLKQLKIIIIPVKFYALLSGIFLLWAIWRCGQSGIYFPNIIVLLFINAGYTVQRPIRRKLLYFRLLGYLLYIPIMPTYLFDLGDDSKYFYKYLIVLLSAGK
jgi:hypothetical protein